MTWDAKRWRLHRKLKKAAGECAWCPRKVEKRGDALCRHHKDASAAAKRAAYVPVAKAAT